MREHLHYERTRLLYDYWDSLREGDGLPARSRLDPVDIPWTVLPHVMLIDVESGETDFRLKVRLMGTAIRDGFGEEATGQDIEEMDFGELRAPIIASFRQVVNTHEPDYIHGEYTKSDGRHVRVERIALPLSSDGLTVTQILVGAVFDVLAQSDEDNPDAASRVPVDDDESCFPADPEG